MSWRGRSKGRQYGFARLSDIVDFPSKSNHLNDFPDRATWLPLALEAWFRPRRRDNRGDSWAAGVDMK